MRMIKVKSLINGKLQLTSMIRSNGKGIPIMNNHCSFCGKKYIERSDAT